MCTEPATAGDVRAAMPRLAAGSAADPIALEPADDVIITTLVDNVYDALLIAPLIRPVEFLIYTAEPLDFYLEDGHAWAHADI